jgi:hypothetical protein
MLINFAPATGGFTLRAWSIPGTFTSTALHARSPRRSKRRIVIFFRITGRTNLGPGGRS